MKKPFNLLSVTSICILSLGLSNFAHATTSYFFIGCKNYDKKLIELEVWSAGSWENRILATMNNMKNIYNNTLIPNQVHVTLFKKEISTSLSQFEEKSVLTTYNVYTDSGGSQDSLFGRLVLFKPKGSIASDAVEIAGLEGILIDERDTKAKVIGRYSECKISQKKFIPSTFED